MKNTLPKSKMLLFSAAAYLLAAVCFAIVIFLNAFKGIWIGLSFMFFSLALMNFSLSAKEKKKEENKASLPEN